MANEKRLIYAEDAKEALLGWDTDPTDEDIEYTIDKLPTADAVEVAHGRWVLTANEESNYRWSVTAECSECHLNKGEVWAGFFPGFPKGLAEDISLDNAESVKLDNYCPNCGAKMDGDGNG